MAIPVGDNYSAASGATIYGGRSAPLIAGTGIVIIDNGLDYQGYQHIGGGKNIPVSAIYTGTPSLLQARIVDDETSAVITDWTTFAVSPAGGVASGTIPMPAAGKKWGRREVRDGVNTALVSVGSKRVGVGLFMLDGGQSNMANRTSAAGPFYPNSSKYVREFGGGAMSGGVFVGGVFRRIGNIADAYPPNTPFSTYGTGSYSASGGLTGDGTIYFANIVSEAMDMNVFILNKAVGGSSISTWAEDGNPGVNNNWDIARAAIIAANGGDFELTRWQIGETDAGEYTQAAMEAAFATVHANLRAFTGRNNSNFTFLLSSLGPGSYLGSAEGDFGTMRLADVHYATTAAGAVYGTGYHDTRTGVDTVHINNDGFGRGERREAKSFLASRGIGASAAGPRILSASRSAGSLDVIYTVAHSGGTALTDGAGGSGAALTGFQHFDAGAAGAEIGYTSTAILNSSQFRVTLASLPVGALTARYGLMNVPHGSGGDPKTIVLASVLCDNALALNMTVGSPLQPCAAIPVSVI